MPFTVVPAGSLGQVFEVSVNDTFVVCADATPATYIGTMFDLFSLTGRGPSSLRNGFVALFTTDLASSFSFQRLLAWGDPIEFPSGAAHCDPL